MWRASTIIDGAKEPDQPTAITCSRGVRVQLDYSVIGDRIQRLEDGTILK